MNLNTQSILFLLYLFTSSVQAQFYNKDEYLALVAGGERRKDVYLLTSKDPSNFNGYDCSTVLPDLPEVVKGGIALPYKDKDGPPMVCGGVGQGTRRISKKCYLYQKESNSWGPGSDLLEARFGATAVPLPDGNTWIFGGQKSRKAELFNAGSGKFAPGPDMPFYGSIRPCAGVSFAFQEQTLFLLGRPRKSEEGNKFYYFEPSGSGFDQREIEEMPGMGHAMDCGVTGTGFGEELVATGGYRQNVKDVSSDAYYLTGEIDDQTWVSHPGLFDGNPKVVGSASLQSYRFDRGFTEPTYGILIDGLDVDTRSNKRFGGVEFGLSDLNFEPYMALDSPVFPHSVPADVDKTKPRKFPAAMWVHPSQVCTKLEEAE